MTDESRGSAKHPGRQCQPAGGSVGVKLGMEGWGGNGQEMARVVTAATLSAKAVLPRAHQRGFGVIPGLSHYTARAVSGSLSLGSTAWLVAACGWEGKIGMMGKWGSSSRAAGPRGLPWPPVPLAQADFTPGGFWSPLPTLGTAGVKWEGGQSSQGESSTGGCPCLSLPFAAGEHQAVVSLWAPWCHLHVPLSHQTLERARAGTAGPGQCGQMLSVCTGGQLSVGITGDGCSSVHLSAHISVPAGRAWGLWSPAWPGGPFVVISQLSWLHS